MVTSCGFIQKFYRIVQTRFSKVFSPYVGRTVGGLRIPTVVGCRFSTLPPRLESNCGRTSVSARGPSKIFQSMFSPMSGRLWSNCVIQQWEDVGFRCWTNSYFPTRCLPTSTQRRSYSDFQHWNRLNSHCWADICLQARRSIHKNTHSAYLRYAVRFQ